MLKERILLLATVLVLTTAVVQLQGAPVSGIKRNEGFIPQVDLKDQLGRIRFVCKDEGSLVGNSKETRDINCEDPAEGYVPYEN